MTKIALTISRDRIEIKLPPDRAEELGVVLSKVADQIAERTRERIPQTLRGSFEVNEENRTGVIRLMLNANRYVATFRFDLDGHITRAKFVEDA